MHHRGTIRALAALCLPLAFTQPREAWAGQGQTQSPPQAQDQNSELNATLALPVSPASIGLLVTYANEPAAQARVRAALTEADGNVRAVAARVVLNAGLRMLIPDLRAALKAEQNYSVASHQIRALMTLQPDAIPDCLAAAARLGEPTASATASMFARLNSAALLTHLAALEEAHATNSALSESLSALVDADSTLSERLLRDYGSHRAAVGAGLSHLRDAGDRSHDDLLLPLLKSDDADVRTMTIWHIARVTAASAASPQPFPADVVATLASLHAANVSAVSFEALGLELLARVSKQPRHERRWTGLRGIRGRTPAWDAKDRKWFGSLITDAESEDIGKAFFVKPAILTGHGISALDEARSAALSESSKEFGVRTVPPISGLLWSDLLKLTQCKTASELRAFATVAYRPDGRPRQITIEPGGLTNACTRAARVLFALSLAESVKPIPATYTEALVLPLQPDRVTCADTLATLPPDGPSARPNEFGSEDMPKRPERKKMRNPQYPPAALENHLQGMVIVEAIVSPTGCMARGTVRSSPHAVLSGAALDAVLDWRYAPTLLKGVAVPVIMDIAVNFSLQP
jgi:TonB family protein